MTFDIDNWLQELGIKDFDELHDDEKETYYKMLEIAESSKITLDGYKGYIKSMRESIEFAIATEKNTKKENLFFKARLKNYILLESFFDRPERARKLLETYKTRARR